MALLANKAFTEVRETDRAEDREIHYLICGLVVDKNFDKWITKSQKCDVIRSVSEVFMDKNLVDSDLSPGISK